MRGPLSKPFGLIALGILLWAPPSLAAAEVQTEGGSGAGDAISDSVVELLAAGDLDGAIIAMRDEPASPKLLYLARVAKRISDFARGPKPERAATREAHQNLAISHHNLYLFLKSRGIESSRDLKEARKAYRKARRTGTMMHRAECGLLEAALTASAGDAERARGQFSKVDEAMLRGDFVSMEYLAAYHAAVGDAARAVAALDEAHWMNPSALLTWLAVSDDFRGIAGDPDFEGRLASWSAAEAERRLKASASKESAKRRTGLADGGGEFRPQKAMRHYDMKKGKKLGRKQVAAKIRAKAEKKGKQTAIRAKGAKKASPVKGKGAPPSRQRRR